MEQETVAETASTTVASMLNWRHHWRLSLVLFLGSRYFFFYSLLVRTERLYKSCVLPKNSNMRTTQKHAVPLCSRYEMIFLSSHGRIVLL